MAISLITHNIENTDDKQHKKATSSIEVTAVWEMIRSKFFVVSAKALLQTNEPFG